MSSKNKMNLSASRVKNFLECSWAFYNGYFLKIPEITHPKTKLGSLCHTILECLKNPRHKKHHELIVSNRNVYASKVVEKLIKNYLKKNPDITTKISSDLNDLIFVALDYEFFPIKAKKVLPPEYEFNIDFGDFSIKGLMDCVEIYNNLAIIKDFKTQSKKFTEDEITNNLQASFYQTAINHQFGLPAKVEFILLRFPPNKKDKNRHLQVVEPLSKEQINGFKYYLKKINQEINELNIETAKDNLKAFKDPGFCNYVCSLREPFDYWIKLDKEGKILESQRFVIDKNVKKEEIVERRRYTGCPAFYNENEQRRNFN